MFYRSRLQQKLDEVREIGAADASVTDLFARLREMALERDEARAAAERERDAAALLRDRIQVLEDVLRKVLRVHHQNTVRLPLDLSTQLLNVFDLRRRAAGAALHPRTAREEQREEASDPAPSASIPV